MTSVWFPRRWLFGGPHTYLADDPWLPDFQLRLSVNDPRLVAFPGVLHVPIAVAGPSRYLDLPIYHLETLRPREERERKAVAYERERPGLRAAGLAFNQAVYLPELRDAPLAEVPPEDAALIDRVVSPARVSPRPAPSLRHATRDEVDALWSRRAGDDAAELKLARASRRAEVGGAVDVELVIRNRSRHTLASPAVQIGSLWNGSPGSWAALPAPLAPGAEQLAHAVLPVPGRPGSYELAVDLVRPGTGWFGAAVRVPVEVVARRRVGIFVRDATRGRARELAQEIVRLAPALEPLVLGAADAEGYAAVPGPEPELSEGLAAGERKLRSFLVARRRLRAIRRRGQPELDALVLVGLEASTLLERWSDLAAASLAADQGAPVLVAAPPRPRSALDRLLLRRLLRLPGVVVADGDVAGALPGFLTGLAA